MKGFVPVTKANLLAMLAECREAIEADFSEKYFNRVDKYALDEEKRVTTRRWYRLWMLPKPRFNMYHIESIEEYSANRGDYAPLEGCPLETLKKDKEHSTKWVESLERVASNENAGEPILLDMGTFKRVSDPYNYHWVTIGIFYTLNKV